MRPLPGRLGPASIETTDCRHISKMPGYRKAKTSPGWEIIPGIVANDMTESWCLGPDSCLLRIVVRETHDLGRNVLHLAVELADLELGAVRGVRDIEAHERNGLLQDRRARAAGDDADLVAAEEHAVAMHRRLVVGHVEAHQHALRMLLAPDQRLAPDEILGLGLERHSKSDAGLERIGLVAELVAVENQTSFDAQHVERFQPAGGDVVRLARLRDRV